MNFAAHLESHMDERGKFVELLRDDGSYQVSFSTSRPGVARGNHWHERRTETFFVVKGKAEIKLRNIDSDHISTIRVSGDQLLAVDIPPRYVHNITNTGIDTMYLVIWSDLPFDPENPDTKTERVERDQSPHYSWNAPGTRTTIEDYS